MGAYNIIGADTMQAGKAEDVSQILANFQALAAIINGGLDGSNLSSLMAAAITSLSVSQNNASAIKALGVNGGVALGPASDVTLQRLGSQILQLTGLTGAVVVVGSGVASGTFGNALGDRGVAIRDSSNLPADHPAEGGYLYVAAGTLHWRGSAGTDTVIAAA